MLAISKPDVMAMGRWVGGHNTAYIEKAKICF